MKKLLYTLIATIVFISCGNNSNENKSFSDEDKMALVEKRILQKKVQKTMGMIKSDAFEIESIKKLGDSTFQAIHNFTNPIFDAEVRMTNYYVFTSDLDSILLDSNLKVQSKVEGDWIDMSR